MEARKTLDLSRIAALLPHGHHMVLLDRVLDLEPGRSIVAVKAVSGGDPCYRDLPGGLPPDRYAYPVSLMLESFGQAAAVLWLSSPGSPGGPDRMILLAAVRDCRV